MLHGVFKQNMLKLTCGLVKFGVEILRKVIFVYRQGCFPCLLQLRELSELSEISELSELSELSEKESIL